MTPEVNLIYFSIIQYCPTQISWRHEYANIGLVGTCPELDFYEVRMTPDNSRPLQIFGKDLVNDAWLDMMKDSMKNRLICDRDELKDPKALTVFARDRMNDIQMTDPSPVRLQGTPAEEFDKTFAEDILWPPAKGVLWPPAQGAKHKICDECRDRMMEAFQYGTERLYKDIARMAGDDYPFN
jgi:hypothetical protein